MPSPIPFKRIIKVLESMGFFFVSQTGSHAKYRRTGSPTLNAIIPIHEKEVRYGTLLRRSLR
ncbi:type II toxin-antitoxin system HicA family toxin [Candidatus Parcubacteria bacterium]|nr:type II toxin-antitoxin system HicA family toxin [Candidatus Parcubacteria bacterium]